MTAKINQMKNFDEKRTTPFRTLIRQRDFRLLWIGEAISLIGDQFYMIALPWLVLILTGDALAMSLVLAFAGIPRALFMLLGGAVTDRFTPRLVMFASNIFRMLMVTLLAGLIITNHIQVWMLYVLALAFGLADAFFFPAQSAITPKLVQEEYLPLSNAIMHGTMQLSLFIGPALAGYLIAVLDGSSAADGAAGSLQGISIAFFIDAFTFLASAITLWAIRGDRTASIAGGKSESMLSSIKSGLASVWEDLSLRSFFIIIAISNFLINGPIIIGIPVLAATRLPEGAVAYGILMSSYGGGMLVGTLLAGTLPQPPSSRMGMIIGVVWSALGLGVVGLGLAAATPIAAAIMALAGIAEGYVVILFITWLQTRAAPEMLGRVMALLMFSSVGMMPLSQILTGLLIQINTQGLFIMSGSLMTIIVLLQLSNPHVRAMQPGPASNAAD